MMGSDEPAENKPPKLLLFSLPSSQQQYSEPPVTPPLQTSASVPFEWEEAPGRPLSCAAKPRTARCLELPPRLQLAEVKVNCSPPTTVLEGPQVGRSLSCALSFGGKTGSFRKGVGGGGEGKRECDREGYFGSWRWNSSGNRKENRKGFGGSLDFSSSTFVVDDDQEGSGGGEGGSSGGGGGIEVKITKTRRRGSLSIRRSQLWATICESLKQTAPWRRSLTKKK
ncbi:uncharacterized protein At4g00950 [Malania oleifera]|uniref:uncharacterized protein At4g00950 n=1 Tax=Malania oleifera TaxID=397392 RepID=UPI0025AE4D67|nr:uncharacterized protein At4g00950 [Malania oleifera]